MSQKKANDPVNTIIVIVIVIIIAIGVFSCDGGSKSHSGNTSKCTICRKSATHTFQGSGYCDRHYDDAVLWAMDHVKN